jgi:pyruvate carboxylase subunit B
MKYWVKIDSREMVVEVDGGQVMVGGHEYAAALSPVTGTPLSVLTLDGRAQLLGVTGSQRGQWTLAAGGRRFELEVLDERTRHIRSLTGNSDSRSAGGVLKAPMPGLVVRIQVELGQQVTAGTPLIVLEAMKMENQLKAPADGTVTEIRVQPGAAVEKGHILITVAGDPGST